MSEPFFTAMTLIKAKAFIKDDMAKFRYQNGCCHSPSHSFISGAFAEPVGLVSALKVVHGPML